MSDNKLSDFINFEILSLKLSFLHKMFAFSKLSSNLVHVCFLEFLRLFWVLRVCNFNLSAVFLSSSICLSIGRLVVLLSIKFAYPSVSVYLIFKAFLRSHKLIAEVIGSTAEYSFELIQ